MREELIPSDREILRPTEVVRSVTDIDFNKYAEQGIVNWGFDIEGTVARPQSIDPIIPKEFITHIDEARQAGSLHNLFLITNRRDEPEHKLKGRPGYAEQAKQILGADLVISRLDDIPGKPNPDMLFAAMSGLGLKPENTAYVGDKLTGDIRFANEAVLGVSIWVNPRYSVNSEDRPLDMLVRRTLEAVHARRLGLEAKGAGPLGWVACTLVKAFVRPDSK